MLAGCKEPENTRTPGARSLSSPPESRVQNPLDRRAAPRDARRVTVEQLGIVIRDGGGVALAMVVYLELRAMRQSMAILAERLGR